MAGWDDSADNDSRCRSGLNGLNRTKIRVWRNTIRLGALLAGKILICSHQRSSTLKGENLEMIVRSPSAFGKHITQNRVFAGV
jgi:hypothetical protein